MGPGLCSDLGLSPSQLPGLGMKAQRLGRGEPANGSPAPGRGEGPAGLWAPRRPVPSGDGWAQGLPDGCSPGTGAALHPGAARGREEKPGRQSRSLGCLLRAWLGCLLCPGGRGHFARRRSAELPPRQHWEAGGAAGSAQINPNKRDPAAACQERAGSGRCPAGRRAAAARSKGH